MLALQLCDINEGIRASSCQDMSSKVLQLPHAALALVLQQLDQRSLACVAVTCSTLSHIAPASTSAIAVRRSSTDSATIVSPSTLLERRCCSLSSFVLCSGVSDRLNFPHLAMPPCPKLRHLHLDGWKVQLQHPGQYPEVLHVCTCLTSLDLQCCEVKDASAVAAAIATLPELRSLTLHSVADAHGRSVFAELQLPLQLTYLSMNLDDVEREDIPALSQLSRLVALGHLKLAGLTSEGLPGGLPSQLVKLTCLDVSYAARCLLNSIAEQFQHLSGFTALQRLSTCNANVLLVGAHDLSGIQHLTHLTSLQLSCVGSVLNSIKAHSLAQMTALQRLDLERAFVYLEALTVLTQLQSLSLKGVHLAAGRSMQQLLSQLSLLTELVLTKLTSEAAVGEEPALTVLTANTNLCSLKLGLERFQVGNEWVSLQPGSCTLYPHLREIDLMHGQAIWGLPLNEQEIQQLCSCCLAVESLRVLLSASVSSTALLPVLQLSGLTHLSLSVCSGVGLEVVGVVGQLTGLKQLKVAAQDLFSQNLARPNQLANPTRLLQLTALTALEELTLHDLQNQYLSLRNKARWCEPPDVGKQLQMSVSVHRRSIRRRMVATIVILLLICGAIAGVCHAIFIATGPR